MSSAPPSAPMMAATRRPSTSYVLASLRALHVDLLLAGGKVGNDRGRAIRAQAIVRWGQNSPNMNPLTGGGAITHQQVGPAVTGRATALLAGREGYAPGGHDACALTPLATLG